MIEDYAVRPGAPRLRGRRHPRPRWRRRCASTARSSAASSSPPTEEGRRYSQAEREMLVAFAEHASLALTDARTVDDALASGAARLADRAPQPRPAPRPPRPGARARRAQPAVVAALFVRPRRVQDRQRQPRPRGGRRAPRRGREAACCAASARAIRPRASEATSSWSCSRTPTASQVARGGRRAILEELERPFEVRGRELYDRRQHRDRDRSGSRRRRPASQRRPGAVPREEHRQGPLADLRAGHARRRRRAHGAGGRAAKALRDDSSPCTTSRSSSWPPARPGGRRGPRALAPSEPRAAAARRLRPDRRGRPAHDAHSAAGCCRRPAPRSPGGRAVAGARLRSA